MVCYPGDGGAPYLYDLCIWQDRTYADRIAAAEQREADKGTVGNRYTVEPVGATPRAPAGSGEEGERDAILADLVAWGDKYPSTRVYGFSAIQEISASLDAIISRARTQHPDRTTEEANGA